MALLIATLLERRAHKGLEARGAPIMILDTLDTAQVAYVEHEGEIRRVWMDARHGFDTPRLLRLAGFAADIYTDPSLIRSSDRSADAQMGTSTCGT